MKRVTVRENHWTKFLETQNAIQFEFSLTFNRSTPVNPIKKVTKGLAVCVCKLAKIKYPNNKAVRFKCTEKKTKNTKTDIS